MTKTQIFIQKTKTQYRELSGITWGEWTDHNGGGDPKAYKSDYILTQSEWDIALANYGMYRIGVPVQITGTYTDSCADGEWTIKVEPTPGDLFLLEIRDGSYRAYIGTLAFDETLCTFDAIEQIATKTNHSHNDKMSKLITEVTKTASFTLADTDSDVMLVCNHATTPIVVTVPTGLTPGKQFYFTQEGAAQVSFAAGNGMTIKSTDSQLKLSVLYSVAQINVINSTSCRLFGDLKV